MRIAMIGRYFNRQGGASRCLAELADRVSAEHEVEVYSNEILDRGDSRAAFTQVPMLARPLWLQSPSFDFALRRRRIGERHDVIHANGADARRADIYTAHSCHAAWLELRRAEAGLLGLASRVYPPHAAVLAWERACMLPPQSVAVAISRRVADELQQTLGVGRQRIRVIYNGVDTREFSPAASRDELRRELGLAPGVTALVFVGYWFRRKGLAEAIGALAALRDRSVELWVVGRDDPERFERLARQLGVRDRVSFLGHRPRVGPLLQAADALVLPTMYEPFGLVILEALACGTPVITTRVAGAAELIDSREQGWLIDDPHDVDELTAALESFLEARPRWPSMQSSARALAERYDWDAIAREYVELYGEVAERKRAGLPAVAGA